MKAIHALAASLLFGAVAFFTVAGLLMINAFEDAATENRPEWLPLPALYSGEGPEGLPKDMRKEQGSRLFGVAVGSLFTFYFTLQAACAAVALLTASAMGGRLRLILCVVVLASVLVGWYLERVVHGLRDPRNKLTDAALKSPTDDNVEKALAARKAFGMWHGVSLLANFGTLGLSAWLAALVAYPKKEEP